MMRTDEGNVMRETIRSGICIYANPGMDGSQPSGNMRETDAGLDVKYARWLAYMTAMSWLESRPPEHWKA